MSLGFGSDYLLRRADFLSAAEAAGAQLSAYQYPEKGPDGETLFTDVAWIGAENARRVYVLVSGTHGVEGICGSGAQTRWLQRAEAALFNKADIAVMLIHAINPHGFAWLRRVTHEKVDLNRNWIDFNAALPSSAAYAEVADLLSPSAWNDAAKLELKNAIQTFAAKRGAAAFIQAVSSGQHSHPDGLFYGGSAPTWSRLTLTKILTERLAHAERVGVLDIHTGLGASGFGELMVTADASAPSFLRARQWYGAGVTPVGSANSASAKIAGDWVGALPEMLPNLEVTGVALEFGTVDVMSVLFALIGDHYLHAHADFSSPDALAIKQEMRRAFYTDNDEWRGMILGQIIAAARSALRALA